MGIGWMDHRDCAVMPVYGAADLGSDTRAERPPSASRWFTMWREPKAKNGGPEAAWTRRQLRSRTASNGSILCVGAMAEPSCRAASGSFADPATGERASNKVPGEPFLHSPPLS